MRVTTGGHLTYCMNVHPGESWDDVVNAVRTYLPESKAALSPHHPLGVGLRISNEACESSPGREQELRDALSEVGAYAFTVNAFPFGAFHHTRVKEKVYQPDWSDPARVTYTLNVARLLAALLPEGVSGSISTVPLGYKYGRKETGDRKRDFEEHLLHTAKGLKQIYDTTGKRIHVGLEPEPDCLLETTNETVDFFRHLFQHPEAELLQTYIGVCLDTCHAAMQVEDPAICIKRYLDENILISKIQLSAALEVSSSEITPQDLHPFDDGVYFHQITSASGKRWRDLPDWLTHPDFEAGDLRIHCHVPLDWSGNGKIRSTRHTLTEPFWKILNQLPDPHLEIETYTFDILPSEVQRSKTLGQSIIDEYAWVLNHISDLNVEES